MGVWERSVGVPWMVDTRSKFGAEIGFLNQGHLNGDLVDLSQRRSKSLTML